MEQCNTGEHVNCNESTEILLRFSGVHLPIIKMIPESLNIYRKSVNLGKFISNHFEGNSTALNDKEQR